MATNRTNEIPDIDYTKAPQVIKALLSLFKLPVTPAPPVTKIQTLSTKLRPGLSPSKIATNIIKRQSEAGAILGPNDDGTDNIAEKMELIRVEEITKALVKDARITITGMPGQTVTITGSDATGIPVTGVGKVVTLGSGTGLIQ
jgi:hypothetical protein